MTYFGGKSQDGVYQTIINQIPMHDRYIEPFLGAGGIMRKKKAAKVSIGLEKSTPAIENFEIQKIGGAVSIIQGCGIDYLRSLIGNKNYSGHETFIYCDPPYLHRNRGKTRYKFEMSDQDHVEMLEILKRLCCSVAISTYPNKPYSDLLKDWRLLEYYSTDRSGKVRTENLFMNYPEPLILHDDSYIGKNAGSRQNLKRKIEGKVKSFLTYPSRVRLKLLRTLLLELPDFEQEYLLSCLKRQK